MQEYPSAGITEAMTAAERENTLSRYWYKKGDTSLKMLRARSQDDPKLRQLADDLERTMRQAEEISKR